MRVCRSTGRPPRAAFVDAPPLAWPDAWIDRHHHHHHRFDEPQHGAGAEVEASRGCPYNCSFCAKIDYRDKYRRRELAADPGRNRSADRSGRRLRLLHRRDLPAAEAAARGPGAAHGSSSACRRASTFGSLICWSCLAQAGCVSIEAGHRKPYRGRTRGARQTLPPGDRGPGAIAVQGTPSRAVRAGEPDRHGAGQ